MSKIKLIREMNQSNLASAKNGDPGPCLDAAVQSAEVVEKLLELVLLQLATPDRVEEELSALWERW